MSVLMVMRVPGDPAKLEEYAQANPETFQKVTADGKERGAIHHRFYGGDGEVVVVDEWETEEGFNEFFNSNQDIPPIMQEVATGEPQISFYRPLDTGDEF